MEEKEFDVSKLYVGCLGSADYLEDGNVDWSKKEANPYFVYYIGPSNIFKDYHVGYDVFNRKAYYFFNEVKGISSVLKTIDERYIIGQSIPLTTILEKEQSRISSSELKKRICDYNLSDALQRDNDEYLLVLKNCLKTVEELSDRKLKDNYIDYIDLLIKQYIENKEDNNIRSNIEKLQEELSNGKVGKKGFKR